MIEGFAYCKMVFENGKPQDFIYLLVNHAFETLTGLKNVIGKRVTEIIPGIREADPELFEIYSRVSETGKPERFEMFVKALKMWFSISVYSPEKECFVAVFDVITERKRAEEALRQSERREHERAEELAALFEAVPTPVFIARDPDCLHLTGNRLAGEILRIPQGDELSLSGPEETRPRHFRTLKDGRELRLDELPAQRAAHGAHVKDFEFTLAFDDGMVRHVLGYGTPLLDDQGRPRGTVAVLVDITKLKQAEEALKLSNAELAAVNRELESFIYSVSHDLRGPLRAISGFSEIMMKDIADKLNDKGKRYLSRILDGTEKMSRLIDDLLNLSRMSRQEIQRKSIDLSEMASSIIADLREANPGRSTDADIKGGLTAFADPGLIEIVLSNLLGNSWKFTSKTEHARIEFGTVEQDGKIVYYVRDNGVGFDQKYAEKMFWPFHRLHSESAFEGTGIGLAIVDRIIRRHGGNVWAVGIKGKGATIYFSLT
jgi:signal transduction histidine kinase